MFLCNSIPVLGTANKICFVICAICFILHEFIQKRVCFWCCDRWSYCNYFTVFIHLVVRMHSPCSGIKLCPRIWQPETVICHFVTFSPTDFTDDDVRLVNPPSSPFPCVWGNVYLPYTHYKPLCPSLSRPPDTRYLLDA